MTEMRREYPEYDDMSHSDLALERERLENEENLLDERTDETVELDKRREYIRILMGKKFPGIGDKETSFIDRPKHPDQTVDFVAQRFTREKYGATIDGYALMEIILKYEIAPKTGNLRLKKSYATKNPVVFNQITDLFLCRCFSSLSFIARSYCPSNVK